MSLFYLRNKGKYKTPVTPQNGSAKFIRSSMWKSEAVSARGLAMQWLPHIASWLTFTPPGFVLLGLHIILLNKGGPFVVSHKTITSQTSCRRHTCSINLCLTAVYKLFLVCNCILQHIFCSLALFSFKGQHWHEFVRQRSPKLNLWGLQLFYWN